MKSAEQFAKHHGLSRTPKSFTIRALAERKLWTAEEYYGPIPHSYGDHAEYFRFQDPIPSRRKAAAIVAHLYNVPDDIEDWAHKEHLRVEVAPFPSWYSGLTTAVVYWSRDHA